MSAANSEERDVVLVEAVPISLDFVQNAPAGRKRGRAKKAQHDVAARNRVEMILRVNGRTHREPRRWFSWF